MNKERRKIINYVIKKASDLISDIEEVKADEEQAHDSLPAPLQGADRGQKMLDAIQALDDALDSLDEAITGLNTAAE